MTSISDLIRKTTSQSEQQREERQAERTNLSQMRDAAFEVVTAEPDLYRKYLTLQADNIRCSAGNVALTLIQLPDASRIGSIDYWHSVGRYVSDEAMQNGAKVFVPPRNKKCPRLLYGRVLRCQPNNRQAVGGHDRYSRKQPQAHCRAGAADAGRPLGAQGG